MSPSLDNLLANKTSDFIFQLLSIISHPLGFISQQTPNQNTIPAASDEPSGVNEGPMRSQLSQAGFFWVKSSLGHSSEIPRKWVLPSWKWVLMLHKWVLSFFKWNLINILLFICLIRVFEKNMVKCIEIVVSFWVCRNEFHCFWNEFSHLGENEFWPKHTKKPARVHC